MFRKFDDGEVKMVMVVRAEGTLAHAQGTMEKFAAELGQRFEVKSMAVKFGVEKARRTPASLGVPTLSSSG